MSKLGKFVLMASTYAGPLGTCAAGGVLHCENAEEAEGLIAAGYGVECDADGKPVGERVLSGAGLADQVEAAKAALADAEEAQKAAEQALAEATEDGKAAAEEAVAAAIGVVDAAKAALADLEKAAAKAAKGRKK